MEERFNLIDEGWIPISGKNPASLREIFSATDCSELGGTSIQKLAVLKLLLAIAQRAITPKDTKEWEALGVEGLGKACSQYLEQKHDLFYLHGERPFLQFPILAQWKTNKGEPLPIMPIGRPYHPDIPSDNDTVINQMQLNRIPNDAQKALFLVSIMNYSFGGKRVSYIPPLSEGFDSKGKSAKSGPSLGNYNGYMQSCFWGNTVLETVWLNLLTRWELSQCPQWEKDELIPPWEEMPEGEDDEVARRLKSSYMGTLVGLSRFVLLQKEGVLYAEGIQYPSHKEGWREPFMTLRGEDKVNFLDMGRKPWRNLDALLSLSLSTVDRGITCPQIQMLLPRTRKAVSSFGLYSGGLKVRGNAGDQSVKQTDDFINSLIWLDSQVLGQEWFQTLEAEMKWLETTAFILKRCVSNYLKELKEIKSSLEEVAEGDFWRYCESIFQDIVYACDSPDRLPSIRQSLIRYAEGLYDTYCGHETARQIVSWVKHRPNFRLETKKEG